MTVPPRRATPALLQVDAVLARLGGRDALAEVARYLSAEFAGYRWVGIYRRSGGTLSLEGDGGLGAEEPRELGLGIGPRGRAATEDRASSGETEGRPELSVPVPGPAGPAGVLTVVGSGPAPLDASDAAFLAAVARKLSATMAAAGSLPML